MKTSFTGAVAKSCGIATVAALAAFGAAEARADKLNDIISSGTLRCGVMLDFPPQGFRDASGTPQGFDVETCKDIGKALGVKVELVETPAPQRIPSLVAGTTDISVAGTTPTLERGKTVTFTVPYNVGRMLVAYKEGTPVAAFDDLKGKNVAVVRGTINETAYMDACAKWAEGCKNVSLATNADAVTALRQGRADAFIENNAFVEALVASKVGADIKVCCEVPGNTDWNAIAVPKGEYGLRDWLNYFVFWQVDTGRYEELYQKFYNAPAPSLRSGK